MMRQVADAGALGDAIRQSCRGPSARLYEQFLCFARRYRAKLDHIATALSLVVRSRPRSFFVATARFQRLYHVASDTEALSAALGALSAHADAKRNDRHRSGRRRPEGLRRAVVGRTCRGCFHTLRASCFACIGSRAASHGAQHVDSDVAVCAPGGAMSSASTRPSSIVQLDPSLRASSRSGSVRYEAVQPAVLLVVRAGFRK